MAQALIASSRLKPEIRLAQAVSEFEADLSSAQKQELREQHTRTQQSPPDAKDVMVLTAEIDRRIRLKSGIGRCIGPRMTNFLQAVQQFAALGDIVVGGSQNIVACSVWSVVRMMLLVCVFYRVGIRTLLIYLVGRIGRGLSRDALKSSNGGRSLCSTLSNDGLTLSKIAEAASIYVRVLLHCCSPVSLLAQIQQEINIWPIALPTWRNRSQSLSI